MPFRPLSQTSPSLTPYNLKPISFLLEHDKDSTPSDKEGSSLLEEQEAAISTIAICQWPYLTLDYRNKVSKLENSLLAQAQAVSHQSFDSLKSAFSGLNVAYQVHLQERIEYVARCFRANSSLESHFKGLDLRDATAAASLPIDDSHLVELLHSEDYLPHKDSPLLMLIRRASNLPHCPLYSSFQGISIKKRITLLTTLNKNKLQWFLSNFTLGQARAVAFGIPFELAKLFTPIQKEAFAHSEWAPFIRKKAKEGYPLESLLALSDAPNWLDFIKDPSF